MKSSNIIPGGKATTKLNGRDQVVTVIGESLGKGGPTQWIVRTPAGNQVYRTARQLREISAFEAEADETAHGYTFADWLAAAGRSDSASEYDLRAAWRAGESPEVYKHGS